MRREEGARESWRAVARWWGMVLVLLVAGIGDGRGQGSLAGGDLDMPVPPPSRVFDAGDVFVRHPKALRGISADLQELDARHGVPVYLAIYSGLIRTDVARQARDLFALWVGENSDGVVVVCDTDVAQVDLGLPSTHLHHGKNERVRVTRLADNRLRPIVRELKREIAGGEDPVDYIPEMMALLTVRLDEVLASGEAAVTEGPPWDVGLLTIGIGIVLATVGFGVARYVRKAEEKAREAFEFPDVLVQPRLGANFGGGKVAVVSFSGERSRDEPEAGSSQGHG